MTLLYFVLFVIVAAAIFAGSMYLIELCPWLPANWKPSVKYVVILILVVIGLGYLISLMPGQTPLFRP